MRKRRINKGIRGGGHQDLATHELKVKARYTDERKLKKNPKAKCGQDNLSYNSWKETNHAKAEH